MRCVFLHYPLACFMLLRWNSCYQVSGSCDCHMRMLQVFLVLHTRHSSFVSAFTRQFVLTPPLLQFMSSVYFIGHVGVFLWLLVYFGGLGSVARRLGHDETKQKTQ